MVQLLQVYLLTRAIQHLADDCQINGGPERFGNALSVGLSKESGLQRAALLTAKRDLVAAFTSARGDLGKLIKPHLQDIFKHHDRTPEDWKQAGLLCLLSSAAPGAIVSLASRPLAGDDLAMQVGMATTALCAIGGFYIASGNFEPYSSKAAAKNGEEFAGVIAGNEHRHVSIEQFSHLLKAYGAPNESKEL